MEKIFVLRKKKFGRIESWTKKTQMGHCQFGFLICVNQSEESYLYFKINLWQNLNCKTETVSIEDGLKSLTSGWFHSTSQFDRLKVRKMKVASKAGLSHAFIQGISNRKKPRIARECYSKKYLCKENIIS